MKWDDMPEDIIRLLWHYRTLIMASDFLENELQKCDRGFASGYLKRIHSVYRILRPDPRYDIKINSLLKEHDIWVHYYASLS